MDPHSNSPTNSSHTIHTILSLQKYNHILLLLIIIILYSIIYYLHSIFLFYYLYIYLVSLLLIHLNLFIILHYYSILCLYHYSYFIYFLNIISNMMKNLNINIIAISSNLMPISMLINQFLYFLVSTPQPLISLLLIILRDSPHQMYINLLTNYSFS